MRINKLTPFLFFIVACSSDDAPQPDLSVYVDRFVAEARARGITLDVSNLTMAYVTETDPPNYCGYGTVRPEHVQIKYSDDCWNSRTDIDKELLTFHELGHAVLGRVHSNTQLSNGDHQSIMYMNPFGLYNESTLDKKAYYLDELFDMTTPEPQWAHVDRPSRVEILKDSVAAVNAWKFGTTGLIDHAGIVSHEVFVSAGHSLSIQANAAGSGISFWRYDLSPGNVTIGSALTLTVKAMTKDVSGPGLDFELQGFDAQGTNVFYVYSKKITGTQDFKEYTIDLYYFPRDVSVVSIFLLMDGRSTGTAYIDDISLVNKY